MEEARGRGCLDRLSAALTWGPTYSGCSPLKRGYLWVATHATNMGQILSITARPTPVPPPDPAHLSRPGGRLGSGEAGQRGRALHPHTAALSLPHPRAPPEPGKPRVSAARPLPGLGRARGPPWQQRHPGTPPRSSPTPRPSSPLLRTRANCEAAPATSGALPGPQRQAPAARSVRWGSQARSSCGWWVRPEPAESTHHGVCARGRGGCPRGEARPKGPRRRRRQRNRTPAAAENWNERSGLGPP